MEVRLCQDQHSVTNERETSCMRNEHRMVSSSSRFCKGAFAQQSMAGHALTMSDPFMISKLHVHATPVAHSDSWPYSQGLRLLPEGKLTQREAWVAAHHWRRVAKAVAGEALH